MKERLKFLLVFLLSCLSLAARGDDATVSEGLEKLWSVDFGLSILGGASRPVFVDSRLFPLSLGVSNDKLLKTSGPGQALRFSVAPARDGDSKGTVFFLAYGLSLYIASGVDALLGYETLFATITEDVESKTDITFLHFFVGPYLGVQYSFYPAFHITGSLSLPGHSLRQKIWQLGVVWSVEFWGH